MFPKHNLVKATKKLFTRFAKQSVTAIKKQLVWLLRTLFNTRRRRSSANAGFVLPTVAMVALVVVLLTTAIMFRSFERAKNASNVRVNEAVLNATTPAMDRARAKLNKLLQDGRLPRATPTDEALYSTLTNNINEYTFGDEKQLKLALSNTETDDSKFLKTAWRYPVDTDNNGKFDSYTLYGIYFKNPPVNSSGQYTRARTALEARTPPMTVGTVSGNCADAQGTSAVLVGNTGWFKTGTELKKAFFVYTANVPITQQPTDTTNYEVHQGNKGFSAIEYQQDRVQLPLVNNAVVYEDDLGLSPGPKFRLNGRIFTNSNFLTGSPDSTNGEVRLYQVSSQASCFYEPDNAKIVVGGNIGAGGLTDSADLPKKTSIDLYKGKSSPVTSVDVDTATKSVDYAPTQIGYNSLAYVQRINRLVAAQFLNAESTDPSEVTGGMQDAVTKLGLTLTDLSTAEKDKLRQKQLELYFKRRTRRVPYQEVEFGGNALGTYATNSPLQGSGNTLRPIDAWIYPTDPTDGLTATSYAKLNLNTNGDKLKPAATEPVKLIKQYLGVEQSFGDRVLIGNNLPELWWDESKQAFVGPNAQDTQTITDYKWNDGDGDRTRRSRVETLKDLGTIDRDGDWELAAAQVPATPQDPVGGLRVVTGAGIYLPDDVTSANLGSYNFSAANKQIWSDLLPFKRTTAVPSPIKPYYTDYGLELTYKVPQPATGQPNLKMRATAVYHYKSTGYSPTNPTPIACVSSYYNPTDKDTARNISALWNIPADIGATFDTTRARSNNGIAYAYPNKDESDYEDVLSYLADLTYPNGRSIDDGLLKTALNKDADKRTLSEKSAIDAAICGLAIFDGTLATPSNTVIDHGSIYEVAFLDPRQIKAIDATTGSTNYDLPKKDRQPLEIRATVLDIDKLRRKAIGDGTPAQEYLLPNSGIIYATRNDALLDLSAAADPNNPTEAEKLQSPVDYKLDPNRRPNAIMLVNGKEIGRNASNTYRDVEKGLILATNLPAYIQGNFNLHDEQEFETDLNSTWGNFYDRTDLNDQFACRQGDPRLPDCDTGDKWRSASVLADSMTLLSTNFRFGFRNEADYDWQLDSTTVPTEYASVFSTVNSFVPQASWHDPTSKNQDNYFAAFPKDLVTDVTGTGNEATIGFQGSSYLNNFVTPILRKVRAKKLVTEVCYAEPCSEPKNWTIKTACPTQAIAQNTWREAKNDGSSKIIGQPITSIKTGVIGEPTDCAQLLNKPSRIAFVRNITTGALVTPLQVYGVDPNTNKIEVYNWPLSGTNLPADATSGGQPYFIPWFTGDASGSDVIFKPVLQFDRPFDSLEITYTGNDANVRPGVHGNWLQVAQATTFNVISAVGDTPAAASNASRATEDNGGLHNLVRFIENWNKDSTATSAKISGAFYQIKRSSYATAPFSTSLTDDFKYKITGNSSRTPFYLAPTREWGYDVALLSQSPDMFAQKLVTIPDDLPNEYVREVGRDDDWIKTLLCAKKNDDSTYAIDANQRPSSCQS